MANKIDKAAQIKQLIDKGDFMGAQQLINEQLVSPTPKKRGRPPKIKETPISPPPPRPHKPLPDCIAPSRKVNSQQTKEIDGKVHTFATNVGWTPPKGNKFKDTGKLVPREKLNYPEPVERRDPPEQIRYQCACGHVDFLYEGQGPALDMVYVCENCSHRTRRMR